MELKQWQIVKPCANCGKNFVTTKSKVKINNNGNVFCSRECYSEYRRKYYIKDKASVYKKIKTNCQNCGKIIFLPPSKFKHINKEGKNNNFCCKECYYQYRKRYYIGDKLYNTGKKMDSDFCSKVRNATLKQYAEGILNRQTKPQKQVNCFLDDLCIRYTNEKTIGYYSIDNYLDDYNLAIEVMGDYFHANPTFYTISRLNTMQNKDIIRDKRKHTYVYKYGGFEILYLWEYDINTNPLLCKELIKLYIKNQGKLNNYHSFNFRLSNNNPILKQTIINPYFIENP